MTTLSAGAAAGLLVTLMVLSTSDSHSLEPTASPKANGDGALVEIQQDLANFRGVIPAKAGTSVGDAQK